MKHLFFLILFSSLILSLYAQSIPPSISLEQFVPKITRQDGANCYAYSAAYVALTTQISASQKKALNSSTTFSFGYVDGYKNFLIKKLGVDSLNSLVNHEIYNDTAEIIGNLDYVFFILEKYGTVKFSEFPYTRNREINKYFAKTNHKQYDFQKIVSINEIFQFGQTITAETINSFKLELINGKPIICSIEQPKADCNWGDISNFERTTSSMGNHIVTIVGYENDKFLIKNNYQTNCLTSYSIKGFLNLLGWAYTFNL